MTPLSYRKIGNLSSRVRVVSTEGRKIAQIGSLARWKRLFPAFLEGEGCPITCPVPEPRSCVTCASFRVHAGALQWTDPGKFLASQGCQKCSRSVQEASGATRRGQRVPGQAQE